MRKALYILAFFIFFFLFLYLTFPFKRVAESYLCSLNLNYKELEVKRFPLRLSLKGVELPGLPFLVERLSLEPSLTTLLSSKKRVKFRAELCGGRAEGYFTYPLGTVNYTLKSVELKECFRGSVKSGELSSAGSLEFKRGELTGGSGDFTVKNLSLEGLSFGLLKAPELRFNRVDGLYRVKGKNLVEIEAQGEGDEARFKATGVLNYNPRAPMSSYLSLKLAFNLKGSEFKFNVRGSLNTLRLQ